MEDIDQFLRHFLHEVNQSNSQDSDLTKQKNDLLKYTSDIENLIAERQHQLEELEAAKEKELRFINQEYSRRVKALDIFYNDKRRNVQLEANKRNDAFLEDMSRKRSRLEEVGRQVESLLQRTGGTFSSGRENTMWQAPATFAPPPSFAPPLLNYGNGSTTHAYQGRQIVQNSHPWGIPSEVPPNSNNGLPFGQGGIQPGSYQQPDPYRPYSHQSNSHRASLESHQFKLGTPDGRPYIPERKSATYQSNLMPNAPDASIHRGRGVAAQANSNHASPESRQFERQTSHRRTYTSERKSATYQSNPMPNAPDASIRGVMSRASVLSKGVLDTYAAPGLPTASNLGQESLSRKSNTPEPFNISHRQGDFSLMGGSRGAYRTGGAGPLSNKVSDQEAIKAQDLAQAQSQEVPGIKHRITRPAEIASQEQPSLQPSRPEGDIPERSFLQGGVIGDTSNKKKNSQGSKLMDQEIQTSEKIPSYSNVNGSSDEDSPILGSEISMKIKRKRTALPNEPQRSISHSQANNKETVENRINGFQPINAHWTHPKVIPSNSMDSDQIEGSAKELGNADSNQHGEILSNSKLLIPTQENTKGSSNAFSTQKEEISSDSKVLIHTEENIKGNSDAVPTQQEDISLNLQVLIPAQENTKGHSSTIPSQGEEKSPNSSRSSRSSISMNSVNSMQSVGCTKTSAPAAKKPYVSNTPNPELEDEDEYMDDGVEGKSNNSPALQPVARPKSKSGRATSKRRRNARSKQREVTTAGSRRLRSLRGSRGRNLESEGTDDFFKLRYISYHPGVPVLSSAVTYWAKNLSRNYGLKVNNKTNFLHPHDGNESFAAAHPNLVIDNSWILGGFYHTREDKHRVEIYRPRCKEGCDEKDEQQLDPADIESARLRIDFPSKSDLEKFLGWYKIMNPEAKIDTSDLLVTDKFLNPHEESESILRQEIESRAQEFASDPPAASTSQS